jgi:hypothetical protein
MPLPTFRVTKKKDGKEVLWFRDTQGRVRTTASATANWTKAEQIRSLVDYGISLQIAQARAGLGSDGAQMPPLKQPQRKKRFSTSQKKVVEYGTQDTGYPAFKRRLGLKPIRDLYGPGGKVVTESKTTGKKRYLRSASHMQGRGHMLDDLRVNFLSDTKGTFAITTQASRVKARANQERAPWWGWSAASYRKLQQRAAELFGSGPAERLFELGLIGASALAFVKARTLRRVA